MASDPDPLLDIHSADHFMARISTQILSAGIDNYAVSVHDQSIYHIALNSSEEHER